MSRWPIDMGQPAVLGSPALCVDVDGTLLKTDLLLESFLQLIRQKPWLLPAVPFWLVKGKAYLKRQLAVHVSMDSMSWCMHTELLQFLKTESDKGRYVVLCSASDYSLVEQVAGQLSFPVGIMASDGIINLKGESKARALIDRFGLRGFDYVGNAKVDLPVWRHARHALVVGNSKSVVAAAQKQGNVATVFPGTRHAWAAAFKAIRVYQWVKNVLIFVPLLTSHHLLDPDLVLRGVIAFVAMSLCASAVYVMNDLTDLNSDRRHPTKQSRPFASGTLPISFGLVLAPVLLLSGITVSLALPETATVLLMSYVVISIIYTHWLKGKLLADVIVLAVLYTLRILEGGAATSLLVSPWLLSFSLFVFVSLAFIKRVAEMFQLSKIHQQAAIGRGYLVCDTPALATMGMASGFLACLVLSLYINSQAVRELYQHPGWLWLLLPLLLYWVSRMWVITMRGEMKDDPILYLFKDRRTYATILAGITIILLAKRATFTVPGMLE